MSLQITLQKIYELLEKGDNSNAIQYSTNALEIYHKDPDLISARAEAFLKIGKNNEALKDFDLAAVLEPKNPFRYSSRAFLKEAIGDIEGALKDYKTALKLDPDDATIQNNLGLLEEKMGYSSKAKKRSVITDELDHFKEFTETPSTKTRSNKTENDSPPFIESNKYIILKVIWYKKYRKEFFQFLMNGFRLKK